MHVVQQNTIPYDPRVLEPVRVRRRREPAHLLISEDHQGLRKPVARGLRPFMFLQTEQNQIGQQNRQICKHGADPHVAGYRKA